MCAHSGVPLGTTFYEHEGKAYSKEAFTKLFCKRCSGCGGVLDKEYIKRDENTFYHRSCFCCDSCGTPFLTDMNDNARDARFIEKDGKCMCNACFYEEYGERCEECNKLLKSGDTIFKVQKPSGEFIILCKEHYNSSAYNSICAMCGERIQGKLFRRKTASGSKVYHEKCFFAARSAVFRLASAAASMLNTKEMYFAMITFAKQLVAYAPAAGSKLASKKKMVEWNGSKYHADSCFGCCVCSMPLAGKPYMEREGKFTAKSIST